ncbi:RNA-binding motif protein, X-linked 2-like [Sorex fumeus]|uniref:RNA-binding motif protein, X-linked 2-like n=1 Tax=Sorex fumeus TaxID=62283 RepID=UPI0024AD4F18|nr:RNA-binding motif protein, X-linked 2-like [Sorex fumeus]
MRSSPYVPTCLISSGRYIRILEWKPVEDEVRLRLSSLEYGRSGLRNWDAGREAKHPRGRESRSPDGAETLPGEPYPLTKLKLIKELKEREVQLGVAEKVSWHTEYKDSSAWIFSDNSTLYGEIVNINLVHNKKTGKSKGFCFLCYEDHRSTILAVDNFNGIKIKGRTIRMDHVSNYRAPKDSDELDDVTRLLQEMGCGAHKPPKFSDEDSEDDKPTKKKRKKGKTKRKKVNEEKREVQPDAPVSSSSPRSKMLKENNSPDCKKFNSKNSKKIQKSEFREGQKQPEQRQGAKEGKDREPKKKKPKQEHRSLSMTEEREEKNRDRDRDQRSDTHIGWQAQGAF